MSGLAIGIDGAAHEGALDAGGHVVGVVATGLDVTYPRRHDALYARVREHGLVVSEHGYGVQPHRDAVPGAQPDHRRAGRRVRGRRGHGRRRRDASPPTTRTDYGRTVFALPGSRRNRPRPGATR